MKKAQRDKMYNIDEFEDLTLFANESFDTQDVDLFEFSSEESSPLTRLKSIILSLDWEINDEILQELADELVSLQAMWQGDKVAEVYLQGLDKIGKYIRGKGHYAHPNSIKLLLTFFYNFEKIISSQNITGEDITKILKGDIRKFKILQYQINQSESELESPPSPPLVAAGGAAPAKVPAIPATETDHIKLLKAAILSLDWEVTDESLKQYNVQLSRFREKIADNRFALVLVQGLQALGDYIGEERAEAHPEAFTLLHSFDEALGLIAQLQDSSADQNKVQEILIEQINRLNNLKLLISGPSQAKIDDHLIDEVVEEISTPVATEALTPEPSFTLPVQEESPAGFSTFAETVVDSNSAGEQQDDPLADSLGAEIDTLFSFGGKPAMESDSVQYPDEVLPPDAIHPVDDELADDLIEASLQSGRGLMPALSGAEEQSGFNEEAEPLDFPAQSDLTEQLDFLFSEAENQSKEAPATPPSFDVDELALDEDELDGPVAALADFEPEAREDDELTSPAGLSSTDEPQVTEAFADADTLPLEKPALSEEAADESLFDIQSKLDTFFADALTEEEEPVASPALADDSDEPELEPEDTTIAALSDVEQPDYVDVLGLEETGPNASDIQDKLDSFFADAVEETEQPSSSAVSVEEIEQSLFFNEDSPVESALANSDEEHGFSEQEELGALNFTPMEEIEEKLDFFFGADGEETTSDAATKVEAVEMPSADSDLNLTEAVAALKAPAIETPDAETADLTALADVESVQAARGDEALLENELEGQLDFLFDSTDDTEAAATEPVDALTLALEASIDDNEPAPALAALAGVAQEQAMPSGDERRHMQLAALGALLPGVVRNISRTKVADVEQAIAALQSEDLPSAQKALVDLLHAAIGLLGRMRKADDNETEKLFNYLYEHMLQPGVQNDALPEAINRYSSWMQHTCAAMPFVPAPVEGAKEAHFEYTAQELYFELAELRANMKQEFAKLRHDMQHKS